MNINPKILFAGLVGISGFVLVILGGMVALTVFFDRQMADYPGATELSTHDVLKVFPNFYYRQDASYKTGDDFPEVYNWYSNGFDLGPEAQAQSHCIHMYKAETTWGITRVMTVTLCDTPNGRMIFVQRSLRLER
ncbi:MAG: hypothetical protein Fur0022_13740 [Anaerolineales bacterium]